MKNEEVARTCIASYNNLLKIHTHCIAIIFLNISFFFFLMCVMMNILYDEMLRSTTIIIINYLHDSFNCVGLHKKNLKDSQANSVVVIVKHKARLLVSRFKVSK